MKRVEWFLNNNMWKISLWLILLVFFIFLIPYILLPVCPIIRYVFWITEITKTIDLQFTITTIWSIIVFWYWYNRYTRNIEFRNLENLLNKLYQINFNEKIWYLELLFQYNQLWVIDDRVFEYIDKNFWLNIVSDMDKELSKSNNINDKSKELANNIVELFHTNDSKFIKYLSENIDKLLKKWFIDKDKNHKIIRGIFIGLQEKLDKKLKY